MNSTGIVRLLDELGRIVLPIELRRMLDIDEGDPVEFFYHDELKTIMVRKYRTEECLFCQGTEQLQYFKNRFVCSSCIQIFQGKERHEEQHQKGKGFVARRKDTLQRLLEVMKQHPNASQKEWATIIGVSQSRISQLIKEMAGDAYVG